MKNFQFHVLIATMLVAGMLTGCRSDVDVSNIDTRSELDMGIALPIGSMSATMGDFLGNGQMNKIVVDADGIFHFIDTVDIPTKDYHSIRLEDYVMKNNQTLEFKIQDQVTYSPIMGNGSMTFQIPFDMKLNLSGINDNLTDERIDSIWITKAKFNSWINVEDFDLNWSEIKSVKLQLDPKQFRRPSGMTVDIPIAGKAYGDKIDIEVDDFTLILMKDITLPPGNTNMVNDIDFKIIFEVCPAAAHPIYVSSTSKFKYDLQVELMDYEAIWGYFEAGNQMSDEDTIRLVDEWPEWENMKNLKVRFAEPRIDIFVSHRVAAPLVMYIDYITAVDSLGNPKSATWNGKTSKPLYLAGEDHEYISPLASTMNDSIEHHRFFNHEEDKGNIDELFDMRPDIFMYGFHLEVDQTELKRAPWNQWKQLRIMKDCRVRSHAIADLPFKFKENSEIQYNMLIDSVNLSKLSLDSLLASVDVLDKDSKVKQLKLILELKNSIPFDLQGIFSFYDEGGNKMNMNLVESDDVIQNRIKIPAPKMNRPAGQQYGYVSEPSTTRLIISVDSSDFEQLSKIKQIRLDASISGNPQPCVIDRNVTLQVRIGLAAHVDAIFDFNNK